MVIGKITMKVTADSFDKSETKKQIPETIKVNRFLLSPLRYLKRKKSASTKNKKHKISSRLFMLATTSVCSGCAINKSDARNDASKLYLYKIKRRVRNKKNPVIA